MKKIFIDRNETVANVIEKILLEADSEVVLIIPKNSVLKESVTNFHLIRKEAASQGKSVFIESVDEGVLALSKASQLEAFHPILQKSQTSSFSDIIPAPPARFDLESRRAKQPAGFVERGEGESASPKIEEVKVTEEIRRPRPKRRLGLLIIIVFIIALLGGGFWATGKYFSRASILISFKKTAWQYDNVFLAGKALTKINSSSLTLPAEQFSQVKNLVQFFPASGSANVSEKSAGKITIYNAYSSESQSLVATTRFTTPDGKIFRLDERVLVPGAKIKDGKIEPSSIEVSITADKPGADYNLGPIPRLVIPGFKGTPKYEGFYGTIVGETKGGFIGKRAVPTEEDVTLAKSKISESLKSALEANFLASLDPDFKIVEGATEVKTTKLTANRNTDQGGNFSVLGEAEIKTLGFKENDLKTLLLAIAIRDNPEKVFKDLKLSYSGVKPNFVKGEITFSLKAEGVLTEDFNPENFKKEVLGKKVKEAEPIILKLKGISSAKLSLWPRWLVSLPKDAAKVEIKVD